jgi:DNA-binding NtrC family response regulator
MAKKDAPAVRIDSPRANLSAFTAFFFAMTPARLSVLVVEDEMLIRWSMAETLAAAGHTVIEAGDAASARRVLARGDLVNVVFLDLRLPDANDLTLLADIRRLAPESAVVVMTAFGTGEIAAKARQLGAYTVLSKPFELNEVEPLTRQAYLNRLGA